MNTLIMLRRFSPPSAASLIRFSSSKVANSPQEALQKALNSLGRSACASSTPNNNNDTIDQPSLKVAVGGFGLCGIPESLIHSIAYDFPNLNNLTTISGTAGTDEEGMGILLSNNKVKRMISSYVGENALFTNMYITGNLEVELTPQGSLAERLRCGGSGIPAFYTPTATGTVIETGGFPIKYKNDGSGDVEIYAPGRESRQFNGIDYLMEEAIVSDVAIIKAYKGDSRGNLIFRGTARNFNPDAGKSGKFCIAEVEEIVDVGVIAPDDVMLSGVYVHSVVKSTINEKTIERLSEREHEVEGDGNENVAFVKGGRGRIVRRASKEFIDGQYVNLGIGIPTQASNHLPDNIRIELQSENGIMGMGVYPKKGEADADWVNASKSTITFVKGASTFCSSDSFGMIRGSKVNLTILGGMQVSSSGDISNWIIPGKMVKGMGGAMDLVSAPRARVVVTMEHMSKQGEMKIMTECDLPVTGRRVVDRIITDMCVFDCDKVNGGLTLIEIAKGLSVEDIRKSTGCDFKVAKEPLPLMDEEEYER